MCGPLPNRNLIKKILKFLNNLRKILKAEISMEKLSFLVFFEVLMFLRPITVIIPFPDLPKECCGCEDVNLILSRIPKLYDLSKMMYFSPLLISLRFLTL